VRRLVPIIVGAAILIVPTVAHAVPITVHEKKKIPVVREVAVQKNIAGDPTLTTALERGFKTITVERVEHVAPVDEDDDGIADTQDSCVFCDPAPVYRESGTNGYSGDGMTSSPVDGYYGTGDAIPSYITQCESGGDYYAQNPSGAYGAYQIMPGTAAAYGCDLSYPAGQDACAAEIYANEGASAWVCG
jgi:hypothetical protein